MADKFNTKNPAVKRIMREMREMHDATQDCTNFVAEALADDIFEWQFVIRGPADTEFANGLYHGRILLPPEYPFKPPSFVMLTPSGRFEVNTKICLSISSHHPEQWQPSWSIRTALMALIAFFPTPGKGAVGSLDFPAEDRRRLAQQSRSKVPHVSSSVRREVMLSLHDRMLAAEVQLKIATSSDAPAIDVASTSPLAEHDASGQGGNPDDEHEMPNAHGSPDEREAHAITQKAVKDSVPPQNSPSTSEAHVATPEAVPRQSLTSLSFMQILDTLIVGVVVLILALFSKQIWLYFQKLTS